MGCAVSKQPITIKPFCRGKRGPFLFLCHGETMYSNEVNTMEKALEAIDNSSYLDQGLHSKPQSVYNILIDTDVKCIITSPAKRCLETVRLILQEHPKKDYIRVIIHPLLIELIGGSYDIPCNTELKKDLYNKCSDISFDWSEFEKIFPNKNMHEHFFLNYIDNFESFDAEYLSLINKLKADFSYDILFNLLEKFKDCRKSLETVGSAYYRMLSFKKFLKSYCADYLTSKSEKVVIVTHPNMIKLACVEKNADIRNVNIFSDEFLKINCLDIITINIGEKVS
jgi:broad specificity phosphatase PhoE